MKCPKCHYLSFDPEPRCKNCGYDLEVADADLAFRAAEDSNQSLPDLPLRDDADSVNAAITLELVQSAKLTHPDDVLREAPPKRPRVAPREPAFAGASRRARNASAPPSLPVSEPVRTPLRVTPGDALPPPLALVPVAPVAPDPAPAARPVERMMPVPSLEPAPASPPVTTAGVTAPAARAAESELPMSTTKKEPVDTLFAEPRIDPPKVAPPTTELPLFVKETRGRAADLSLESPAEAYVRQSAHRPPLVVRRPVEAARPPAPPAYVSRSERRVGPLDHDLLEDLRRVEREEAAAARAAELAARAIEESHQNAAARAIAVAPSQRLTAAALDALLLGGIGTFVLWATLRVTHVPASAFGLDAIVPLAVFLAGVGVSYLLMFTLAGGQTIGKMLSGIRVVPEDDPSERVSFRQAAIRALLAPLSVAVLGLGWWPALFGRVALHDRVVHTRVVRA